MMNSNEYRFYKLLNSFIDQRYVVIPQVHLDDLVSTAANLDKKSRLFSFRHVNQKSVDFVIAEKVSMTALLAMELDGQSHRETTAIEQDKEKERILIEAKIKLIRFENAKFFNTAEIKQRVETELNLSRLIKK